MFALIAAAPAPAADSRLAGVTTWTFAIGSGNLSGDLTRRYASYDLVIVDGEEARAGQVAAIRQSGAIVLAYISVGTIEPGRSWYRRARLYRLELWGDWGEWYANVARPGMRRLITRSVAPKILAKGFDGLFLDNVDMIETHRKQKRGMRMLVRSLSKLVRARGGLLFTQNGFSVIGPLIPDLDGWNREDVGYSYDFDRTRYYRTSARDTRAAQQELRTIKARGLLTLATSYTRGSAAERTRAAELACGAGALPYVSNIGLTRLGTPLSCP